MMVYWTANFRMSAVAYIKFVLAFYLTLSTAQGMGLFMSIFIPSMQFALVLAPPITLFFVIMGGFYIPFVNINPGIQWASWLSFARYGYSALIINEYAGREIPCLEDGDAAIQIGGASTCPLPGDEVIASLGINGIAESFWFNICVMFLLQIFFRIAAYILLRRSNR
jgi:ABC-type multidrug transport system permease subunit